PGYCDQGLGDPVQGDHAFGVPGQPDPGQPDPGQPDQGYGDPGQPDQGYGDPGQPDQGYGETPESPPEEAPLPGNLDDLAKQLEDELRDFEDEDDGKKKKTMIITGVLGAVAVLLAIGVGLALFFKAQGTPVAGGGALDKAPNPNSNASKGPEKLNPGGSEIEDPADQIDQVAEQITELSRILRNPTDSSKWEQSEKQLASFGKKSVPALKKLLRSTNAPTRIHAARALGTIGEPAADAVTSLIGLLGDKSHGPRGAASEALVSIGAKSLPPLTQALRSTDPNVRGYALATLGEFEGQAEAAIPRMAGLLQDENRYVRVEAAKALVKVGEPAVPALLSALNNGSATVKIGACEALGDLASSGPEVLAALKTASASSSDTVRNAAFKAFGKMGPSALGTLFEMIAGPDEELQQAAADAVSQVGAEAVPELILRLQDAKRPQVRYWSAYALGA
ncbi:MAG: HEAT repeat domain-containing protein, partial [Planctomycetales bacterium]